MFCQQLAALRQALGGLPQGGLTHQLAGLLGLEESRVCALLLRGLVQDWVASSLDAGGVVFRLKPDLVLVCTRAAA